jgi:hypothetical protein
VAERERPGDDLRPEPVKPGPRFDPGSVATGLFFLCVAALFITGALGGDPIAKPQVMGPALLVGLGLVGIVRIVTRSRRHR